MDPTRLMTQEATITHVTQDDDNPDEYGNPTYDDTDTTVQCWLHPAVSSEQGANDTIQTETWALYLPPDATLNGGDRVTVAGTVYEADGAGRPFTNPRTRQVTHIECSLRRTT